MFSDTITLFNRRYLETGDLFYPTVISGVDFNADLAQIITRFGAESKNRAILHIPFITVNGDPMIASKTYLNPKVWQRQTLAADFSSSITFTAGQEFDFFILGSWSGTEAISDNSYTAGFYDYCNKYYDHCYAIAAAAQYSVIPHFEIAGR